MNLEEQLRELEESLMTREVRQSQEAVDRLLSDDFLEFGSSGRVFDKQGILQDLRTEGEHQSSLDDFRMRRLGDGVSLVTYRSTRREGGKVVRVCWRSSIWRREGESWRVLFHQGTPTEDSTGPQSR